MTVSLSYTVADIISAALSKIGVNYSETEPKNVEDAHRALNMMIGAWSADPDLAIARIMPLAGYTELSDPVRVPPEFIHALTLNLAVELGPDYDQPADKILLGKAEEAKSKLAIFNIRRISGKIPTNGVLG